MPLYDKSMVGGDRLKLSSLGLRGRTSSSKFTTHIETHWLIRLLLTPRGCRCWYSVCFYMVPTVRFELTLRSV